MSSIKITGTTRTIVQKIILLAVRECKIKDKILTIAIVKNMTMVNAPSK